MSDAMEYISQREIPQLFECLMTALMYHRPADHLSFIQESVEKVKARGVSSVRWDLFLEDGASTTIGKAPLPPVTPPGSSRTSSRAASRTEFVAEKKTQPLPPIAPAAATAAVPRQQQQPQSQRRPAPLACPVALVLGGPGSGRRRVCQALAARYEFRAVSLGDLVRAGGVAGDQPLPDAAALALLADALGGLPSDCRGVFIEGYPRSREQLTGLLDQVPRLEAALLLDFDEATLRSRLERATPAASAAVAARLEEFRTQTLPVCRYLEDEGKLLLLPLDGEPDGGDSAIVSEAAALLDPLFKPVEASVPSRDAAGEATRRSHLERISADADDAAARHGKFRSQAPPLQRYRENEGKLLPLPANGEPDDDSLFQTIEAPIPAGPLLYIRSLASDPLAAAGASGARTPDLPACPIVLIFGGPGSRRAELTRRLAAACDGCLRIDVTEGGDRHPAGDGAALERLLARTAAAAVAAKQRPPRCVLLEGVPTCEAGLRDFCARLGRPELALLVDCQEADMLGRLAQAGAAPREAGERMRYFKEETLPVVRHLDEAGRLFVVPGDREEDAVAQELKSVMDFVLHSRLPAQPEEADRIQKQPVLLKVARELAHRR